MSYSRNETTHAPIEKTSFFKKMGHPRPLFRFYFRLFKQTLQFLQKLM